MHSWNTYTCTCKCTLRNGFLARIMEFKIPQSSREDGDSGHLDMSLLATPLQCKQPQKNLLYMIAQYNEDLSGEYLCFPPLSKFKTGDWCPSFCGVCLFVFLL